MGLPCINVRHQSADTKVAEVEVKVSVTTQTQAHIEGEFGFKVLNHCGSSGCSHWDSSRVSVFAYMYTEHLPYFRDQTPRLLFIRFTAATIRGRPLIEGGVLLNSA